LFPTAVLPIALRTLGGGAAVAMTPTTPTRIDWIAITWATIATLLFARWLLLRTRTISAALRTSSAPSHRELNAVRDARTTLGIRTAIDAIRSPICEAPAVLRIIRPVIALPAHGCDDLSDDELRSLVLHECAHVARHDNLGAILQALATSLLWFHPFVWLASRSLTVAREEACDEVVADAMQQTDSYVSALTKICHAIVAPRAAGASCMASAKIKERMEHLMSYATLRKTAWSHRAMVSIAILLLSFSTIATASDKVTLGGDAPGKFTGEPVSLNLKDADIRDVLNTFGALTKMNVEMPSDVSGTVTIDIVDVPWDQALDLVLRQNGLIAEIDGNTIHVKRK
jgi:beta-lactamase regulating signal transducer with metallopeptidase domain